MTQLTFGDFEYSQRRRPTKREMFLRLMDEVIDWHVWVEFIKPYYPKGKRGRPPMGIEKMLRMYLLQCWFNLSDEGLEDAIYDSYAMRCFLKINFHEEQVPDATTLLKFRHLLEKHSITEKLFNSVSGFLESQGYMMRGGTIVDATIISAPSSTKNVKKERSPEMRSTKKGNQFHYGMKCHIGVDAGTGYVHSMKTTPANEHDITVASELIRSGDTVVYGDSGYIGLGKRDEVINNKHLSEIDYKINRRPKSVQSLKGICPDWEKDIERKKSSVRSKVEHPFLIIKRIFGFAKTVYRGIAKNTHRLFALFVSANLLMLARSDKVLRPT